MEETLVDQLSCPICFEIPESEIYQCQNGHTICSLCSVSLTACPQCRVVFGPNKIRNRALEMILDGNTFNCPNKDAGCEKKVGRKELQDHSKECPYREGAGNGPHNVPNCAPSAPPLEQSMNARRLSTGNNKKSQEVNSNNAKVPKPGTIPQGSKGQANSAAGCGWKNKYRNMLPTLPVVSNGMNFQLSPACSGIAVLNNNNGIRIVSHGSGSDSQPSKKAEAGARRVACNETLTLSGMGNYVVTAENGGHLVVSGCCNATVNGTLQTVTLSGTGSIKVCGNVRELIQVSGFGSITVSGDVIGNIEGSGMGNVTVKGRHYGKIHASGLVRVCVG